MGSDCHSSDSTPSSKKNTPSIRRHKHIVTRNLRQIDTVDLRSNVMLYIYPSDYPLLIVSATDPVLPEMIATTQTRSRLRIAPAGRKDRNALAASALYRPANAGDDMTPFPDKKCVTVEVGLPVIPDLRISGQGSILVSGLDQDDYTINYMGSGNVRLSGRVEHIQITHSGIGCICATELQAHSAVFDLKSAGSLEACVSHSLIGHSTGSGNIFVSGSPPLCHHRSTGPGKFIFR